jgi:hypothetical protein
MDPLQLLPAGRSNLRQPLGSRQLAIVGVEHRHGRHVRCLRLGERRAVDLRERLSASYVDAEIG